MGPELHVTVVGLAIACGVLAAVVVILGWMLRGGRHVGAPLAEDKTETAPVVLVPVTAQSPPEALRLAALLASQATAGIVLLHVIEVPYTLPLDVSEPGGDQRGSYLREFRRLLEAEGLVVEVKVARSRRAGKVIADMARALRPRAVVLSAQPRRGGLSATAAYVLENTPSSRVIIYKASSEAAAATPLPVEQAGRRPAS